MPVLRFPHIPPRFASEGWLTTSVGQSDPSTYQRHPRYPDSRTESGACPSLSPALGTNLALTPRESSLFCYKQAKSE
jgi:hypothetical protein